MASFEPQDFGLDEPPPRPATPPIRRGFVVVLFVLCFLASLVYGVPYMAEQTGYAWEAGRSRAASEALAKLDEAGIVNKASALFRMATVAVSPAVVRIETQRFKRQGGRGAILPGGPGGGTGIENIELGSGVIIDKAHGFIVTNNHVIKDADQIVVRLSQGTIVPGRLVGADPKSDLAVIQIKGPLAVAAKWGDSDKLDIGDWVLAIGSPYALDRTVTAGIISATERNDLRFNEYESFLQTDAAINPGNSGGPLIDLNGRVIGINTAIYTLNQGNEGIGLAIPSTMARRIVENLIKDGHVTRGYLGVRIRPLTSALVKEFKLPDGHGAQVIEVQPGSPAEAAGLRPDDVIVALDGKAVADPPALRNRTAGLSIDSKVALDYYRDGTRQSVAVTIAALPDVPILASYGLRVRDIPGGGVEIDQMVAGSPAARAGLRPGMRILGVGPTDVRSKEEYEAALATIDPAAGLPLRVQTPDGQVASVRIGGPGAGAP